MYIERIEQLEKGRRRLVFETGERLVLYKGEIRSYDLSEGQDPFRRHFIRNCSVMFLENGRQSGQCIC